jgi:hypothetical protein
MPSRPEEFHPEPLTDPDLTGRGLGAGGHWVSTATLVSPRMVLVESVNVTKMRLLAGSNGTAPLAVTKIPKVGVAPELIVVATLPAAVCTQAPVDGFVWQTVTVIRSVAAPVLVVTVMVSPEPRLSLATANTPVAGDPLVTCTMPSFFKVATRAMTSGVGFVEACSRSVLSPVTVAAGVVPAQLKLKATFVGEMGALGVSAMTKLCDPFAAMLTGVLGEPVKPLVAGFVVW